MSFDDRAPIWLLSAAGSAPAPQKKDWLGWKNLVYKALEDHFAAVAYDNVVHVHATSGDDSDDGSLANPIKTLAGARAKLTANRSAGETTQLLFRSGETWRERAPAGSETLILEDGDGIASYGNSGHPPILTGFQDLFTSGWTLVAGTHYKRSYTETPEALRRSGMRWRWDAVYLASGTSDADASAYVDLGALGWWYYDSTNDELHVDFGVDPNTIPIEVSRSYGNNSDGVSLRGSAVVSDLIVDGYCGTNDNDAHNVDVRSPGNSSVLIRNVSSAYAGRSHVMVRNSSWGGAGLIWWDNCEAGYPTNNDDATVFNDYGTADLGPTFFRRCVAKRGLMPRHDIGDPTRTNYGRGFSGHTNHGNNTIGFVLVDQCEAEDHVFGPAALGSFGSTETLSDISDADGWKDAPVIVFAANRSVPMGQTQKLKSTYRNDFAFALAANDHVYLNGNMPNKATGDVSQEGLVNGGITPGSVHLQNNLELDYSEFSGDRLGLINPTGSGGDLQMFGNNFIGHSAEGMSGAAYARMFNRDYGGGAVLNPNFRLRGNIFQYLSSDEGSADPNVSLSIGNADGTMEGNAYFGIPDYPDDRRGYSSDTSPTQLQAPVRFGSAAPVTTEDNPCEYDFFNRVRATGTTAIGPVASSGEQFLADTTGDSDVLHVGGGITGPIAGPVA